MRILIVRHGDPDYEHDSLTEKGWREADYLSDLIYKMDSEHKDGNTYYYSSPYGRAWNTASQAMKKLDRTAEVLPWIREFDIMIDRPDDTTRKRIPWDWLPQDWTQDQRFYHGDQWFKNERMEGGNVGEEYRKVTDQFDALLAKHGYRREGGNYYIVEKPNHDTIVLFCHFGVESVLLSHIWGVSPMVVWHGFCAQPSSVTTIVTEERRKGVASLRMLAFGETNHLYMHDEEPGFPARFCECYDDETRHD